jgi:hypothetical protein
MGFFDFLKQPRRAALDDVSDGLLARIFPGGKSEIDFRARKVSEISNGKLHHEEAASVVIKVKARVWIAATGFDGERHLGVNANELIQSTQRDSGGKLSSFEAASVVFYAIFDKIESSLKVDEHIQDWSKTLFGAEGVGVDSDAIPQGIGEFGFDATNPIPVRGLLGNEIYLKRLRTNSGRKVGYSRLRSLSAPNIFGTVDEYEINEADRVVCKLYISPYNKRISRRPPEGFLLIQID